jgi:hypothetical protein
MKITSERFQASNGEVTKKHTIELDDKELEILTDAMDSKEVEELEKINPGHLYRGIYSQAFEKAKEMAKILHVAFMAKY